MREKLKQTFREEEEIFLVSSEQFNFFQHKFIKKNNFKRDILELHKAEETEKRNLLKLKQEDELIDNLTELVKFMDLFV